MFDYSAKQKTYEIHGVKIGGEPGLNPTVMVGSLFYSGDKNVTDPSKGVFDKAATGRVILEAEEMTEQTGLPSMIDLVAENTEAAARFLEFVVETTDMPVFLDVVSEGAQAEALGYAEEIGVIDRIILNSLSPHSGDPLYEAIKDAKLKSSVILTHSTKYLLSSNKDSIIDELAPKAEAAGIDLQLSGHTHYGQLWPFNYITNVVYELSYGYMQIGQTHFYVSSGFGTWGPPVRLGNRPEIVQIKLIFD